MIRGNRFTRVFQQQSLFVRTLAFLQAIAAPLAAALILWILLVLMLRLADINTEFLPLLLAYIGLFVLVLSGHLVLSFTDSTFWPGRVLITVVVGFSATVLTLLIGVFIIGSTAYATFSAWALFITLLSIVRFNRSTSGTLKQHAPDLFALFCIAALSGFVCRHAATAEWLIQSQGNIQLWWDYYIHGSTIAQFGDPLAIDRNKLLLSDHQLEFYHYGTYLLPAILLYLFSLSGLVAASAILLPFGLVIGAAGAYGLACTLANRWAGVLVLIVLFMLPDSAAYGLKNGFFSFQWMAMASPGVGYGLGVAAASIACANRWWTSGRTSWIILSLVLALLLIQIRVHIFVLLLPTMLLAIVLTLIVRRNWKSLSAVAVPVIATGLLLLVIEPMPTFVSTSLVKPFLVFAHTAMAPTAYDGLYTWILQNLSDTASIFIGVTLIILAVLGMFVILYPIPAILYIRRKGFSPADSIPISSIIFYIALILLSPSSEFQHRPYVLVYLLVVIFTAAYVVRLSPLSESGRVTAVNLTTLVVGAASMSALATSGFDPGRPRFAWGLGAYNWHVDPSVLTVANFIRHEARPGDTIAFAPVAPGALVNSGTVLASLTNIPVYLGCPTCAAYDHGQRLAVESRLRELAQVEAARSFGEKNAILWRMGISWYVLGGGSSLSSDAHVDAVLRVPFGVVFHLPEGPESELQARKRK